MLKGYWPLIGGLASFLAPFVIVNVTIWKKKDMIYSSKIAYAIASTIVCLFFIGLVLVNAILFG